MKSWDYLMRDTPIYLQNLFAVAIRARQQLKMLNEHEKELSIAEALDVRQQILHPVEEEAGPNDVLRKV